jgi:thiamine-phosphate pyrophosphorylase
MTAPDPAASRPATSGTARSSGPPVPGTAASGSAASGSAASGSVRSGAVGSGAVGSGAGRYSGTPVPGTAPGDAGLRARLAAARLYLCTDARERQGDLETFLDAALSGGVDIVQLRQKGLEAAQEMRYLEVFRRACDRHGGLLAVNDRADIARGQDDLPVPAARQIVGAGTVIGLSSHSPEQAAAASASADVDYFCTGPVWPTPTKPGRPAPGLPLVRYAAGLAPAAPWFAIGGIDLGNLGEVLDAGARRIVVVRAITGAPDPAAAAAALAARLPAA